MPPHGAGDGSGPGARRLRWRRRGRSDGPFLDRTLRHPPGHERDQGTQDHERAGHDRPADDATTPDQRCGAHLAPDGARHVSCGAAADVDAPCDHTDTARAEPPATSAAALPPTSTSTPSAAGTPAPGESGGLGALGWTLLILLVVGLIAAWMLWRSRRRSAWDSEAGALETATRSITSTRLPSVLTAGQPGVTGGSCDRG